MRPFAPMPPPVLELLNAPEAALVDPVSAQGLAGIATVGNGSVCCEAREDTITERADDTEGFEVAPLRIKSRLDQKVRGLGVCISPGLVQQALGETGGAD